VIGELRTTGQETGSLPRLNDRERRRAAASVHTPAPGRYLAVESEGDEDVLIPVEGAVTRLGRSLGADVHLDDPSVSRRHALVVQRGGGFILLDDRSMNGTWLNGERVRESRLADGDVIELGAVRMRFVDVPA
jgi:pSer/pThr/pTyr-binding forkhead associated (FHA) protein